MLEPRSSNEHRGPGHVPAHTRTDRKIHRLQREHRSRKKPSSARTEPSPAVHAPRCRNSPPARNSTPPATHPSGTHSIAGGGPHSGGCVAWGCSTSRAVRNTHARHSLGAESVHARRTPCSLGPSCYRCWALRRLGLVVWGRGRALPSALVEGLTLGIVPAIVALRLVPHVYEEVGPASLALLALGLLLCLVG